VNGWARYNRVTVGRERVLVVHDDAVMRRTIVQCLRAAGLQAVQSPPAAAFDRLRREQFDLVLGPLESAVEQLRLSALQPMLDVTETLVSETSLAAVATALLERVQVDASAALTWLVIEDEPALIEVSGTTRLEPRHLGQLAEALLRHNDSVSAPRVLAAAELAAIVSSGHDADGVLDRLKSDGWERLIVVPIGIKGARIGAVLAAGRAASLRTDPMNLRYLSILAAQTAVAIQNMRLYHRARSQSLTDPLTGLWNSRYLRDHLADMLEHAERTNRPLSLVVVDSDSLKQVNDRFGHLAGDRLVSEIASTLRGRDKGVRLSDVVVRYAGDEFVVLMPDTDKAQAGTLAERLRSEISSHPFRVGDESITCTISLGVATFPEDAETPDDLLRAADHAMYEAKRRGKNLAVTYSGELNGSRQLDRAALRQIAPGIVPPANGREMGSTVSRPRESVAT
jgi:diguanylate cyclase (GGDEF)-like protein